MTEKPSHLTLVVNRATKPPVPDTPLTIALRNARETLSHVTDSKYLYNMYGGCQSWSTAVRLGHEGWVEGLNQPSQMQIIYVALKGLIEAIAPGMVNGQYPADTGKVLTKAESIKVGARRQLLQAAEQLLATDTRQLNIIQERRDTITALKAETDRAWGAPPPKAQRSLFDNA